MQENVVLAISELQSLLNQLQFQLEDAVLLLGSEAFPGWFAGFTMEMIQS